MRAFYLRLSKKHEYAYEMCQLQELIIKKQDERWILYLNDEVMGYVEVKKVFIGVCLCGIGKKMTKGGSYMSKKMCKRIFSVIYH